MLVRMLVDYKTSGGFTAKGEVVPLPPGEAGRLVRLGRAELATRTIETSSVVHPLPDGRAERRYREQIPWV